MAIVSATNSTGESLLLTVGSSKAFGDSTASSHSLAMGICKDFGFDESVMASMLKRNIVCWITKGHSHYTQPEEQ